MKKSLIGLFLLSITAFATISSTAQWELRTTGNDNNGGFFNRAGSGAGTDFSQQNANQYTFADLASTNGTTNPCVVTSASHNFVAADNRNGIHISAGTNWITGWYEIVSTSANAATLDRACGSVASISGGTFFVGGGLLTPNGVSTALGNGCGSGNSGTICGTVNVQSGTYTITATVTISASGFWQGYQTTHGDAGIAPTITTATNSTDLFHINGVGSGTSIIFDNFIFTNTAITPAIGIVPTNANSPYTGVRNSSFSGFTNAINGDNVGAHFLYTWLDLLGVEIKNSTGAGINNSNGNIISCNGCWIHNNTGSGIQGLSTAITIFFINSISSNNGINGIDSQGKFECAFSNIANNTGDGVGVSAGSGQFNSNSCTYYGNGGWGINAAVSTLIPFNMSSNDAFGANTSGAMNNFNAGLNDVTLTANPFTSATNFALNGAAGGGAAINTKGFPGTFPGGSTVSTTAIGAVQSSSGGGGGSNSGQIIYIR